MLANACSNAEAKTMRFPYANEAKAIIAEKLRETTSPHLAAWFGIAWKIHKAKAPDGSFVVERNFFEKDGCFDDHSVKAALEQIFSGHFAHHGNTNSTMSVSLPQIAAPANQIMTGARAPEPCCFGGACPKCPLHHA